MIKYKIRYEGIYVVYAREKVGFWPFYMEDVKEIGVADSLSGAEAHIKKHKECEEYAGNHE